MFAKYVMIAVGLVVDQFSFAREKSKRVRRDDGAYSLVIVHIGQLHLKVPALKSSSTSKRTAPQWQCPEYVLFMKEPAAQDWGWQAATLLIRT